MLEGTLKIFATLFVDKDNEMASGQINKDKSRWVCKLTYIQQKLWLMPASSILWLSVAFTFIKQAHGLTHHRSDSHAKCFVLLSCWDWQPWDGNCGDTEEETAFDVTLDDVAFFWVDINFTVIMSYNISTLGLMSGRHQWVRVSILTRVLVLNASAKLQYITLGDGIVNRTGKIFTGSHEFWKEMNFLYQEGLLGLPRSIDWP